MRRADFAIVHKILHENVPEREVLAFGSRVNGSARKYSDLDLVVLGETPLPFSICMKLESEFEYSYLLFKVDVLDWCRITESFRAIVRKCAVTIHSAEKSITDFDILEIH